MSNKWTGELINKHIKVGYWYQIGDNEKFLVCDKTSNNTFFYDKELMKPVCIDRIFDRIKFYDQYMNLIDPPQEREFDIIGECYAHINCQVILLPESDELEESVYKRLPDRRKYKRYKDNGELEVIDENN